MQITYQWLKNHLDTAAPVEAIIDRLNSIGLEVEDISDLRQIYHGFIIAEVLDVAPHPQASRLNVCTVNCGKTERLQVVCGAGNVRPGIKVVLATLGSKVPSNGLVIQAAELRGVTSEGMLCSAAELGLEPLFQNEEGGIVILPAIAPVGQSFAQYAELEDVLIQVNLTPNRRRDCLSVKGIARDLAGAAGLGQLLSHSVRDNGDHQPSHDDPALITANSGDSCRQVSFVTMDGITNTPISDQHKHKPAIWTRLLQITGHLSGNTLVDISNYIMYDLGYPNHLYDLDKIAGTIHIRQSTANEEFIALGGTKYLLPQGLTVIADDLKILAVAGVIGGELSKVDHTTSRIVLEFADFTPKAVISAAKALNISTDARLRFASGIDPSGRAQALEQAIQLIHQHCGGVVTSRATATTATVATNSPAQNNESISFSYEFITRLLGITINPGEIDAILERLGFIKDGTPSAQGWASVHVPSWRCGDITSAADIAEEVMRSWGVEKIPARAFSYMAQPQPAQLIDTHSADRHNISACLKLLRARGYSEVINYSLCGEANIRTCGIDEADHIKLANPISNTLAMMRRSLIPGMLNNIRHNVHRGYSNISIFEYGNVYGMEFAQGQTDQIAVIRAGQAETSLHGPKRDWDFFDVRQDLLALIVAFGAKGHGYSYNFSRDNCPNYYHPGKSATIVWNLPIDGALAKNLAAADSAANISITQQQPAGQLDGVREDFASYIVGQVGAIHPKIAESHDLPCSTIVGELFMERIRHLQSIVYSGVTGKGAQSGPPSLILNNYQSVARDLSFLVAGDLDAGNLLTAARKIDPHSCAFIRDISIFDVYQNDDGSKFVGIKIILQASDHTMEAEEIATVMEAVVIAVKQETGAILRQVA